MREGAQRTTELLGAVAGLAAAVLLLLAAAALIGIGAGGPLGALIALVVAAVGIAAAWMWCERLALSAMLARPVSEVEQPELYRLVRELSKAGRLPVPRLYVSPAIQPNAFTVGRGPRKAALCCTDGLLEMLGEDELRGVLGHELAHVASLDVLAGTVSAGLATVITFPVGLGGLLSSRSGLITPAGTRGSGLGRVEALLMLVFGPVAAAVIRLSVSPEREYQADAGAARIAGNPEALARALRMLDAGTAEFALAPDGRRAAVAQLMALGPFRPEGVALLFRTHPPTGERIRRLESLAGYRR